MANRLPTKGNLMAAKRSRSLAQTGYELMDRKRNILVREMMQLIDRAAVIQDEIATAYSTAYKALQRANITLGVVGEFAKTVPVETGLSNSAQVEIKSGVEEGMEVFTQKLVESGSSFDMM